jgi:hypothetical protein
MPLLYALRTPTMARHHDHHPYVESSTHLIIYQYDGRFVEALDRLYDDMASVFKKHGYDGDYQPEHYFDQNLIVELLIDKLRNLTDHEEVVMDTIFDDFKPEIANDLIDELTNFLHLGLYPFGLEEIISTAPDDCFLIDITFDEDSDGTYYSFDSGNS